MSGYQLNPMFFVFLVAVAGIAFVTPPVAAADAVRRGDPAIVEPPTPRPALKVPKPKTWPFSPWSYAKAYTYNFSPEPANILEVLNAHGTWNSGIRSEQFIADALALKAAGLVAQSMGTFETTKCTLPRHGVVLFDRNDKPVAAASVCFDCEGILVWPDYERPEETEFDLSKYQAAEKRFKAALEDWKGLFGNALGMPIDYRSVR